MARGFEDDKIQQGQTDSLACSKESQRLALALIAASQRECKSMDIKTAFLQGKLLEREVFMKPPKEANTKKVSMRFKFRSMSEDSRVGILLRGSSVGVCLVVLNQGCCSSGQCNLPDRML